MVLSKRKAPMSHKHFIDTSRMFKEWCCEALHYWAKNAADPRGGYAEHLDMDGSPDFNHIRRVRVQARQAYVYAHAGHLGWYKDARAASDQAWNFVIGPGSAGGDFILSAPKGCAHLVKGNGDMHDDMRDTYAQAFVLLSGAWRYKAFGDQASLNQAEATLDYLNNNIKSDAGGWLEALPLPQSTTRRQNPHMHLFEAFLALYEVTRDKKYLALSDEMFALFQTYFFDQEKNALLEFFTPNWIPKDDGGPIEPGHMMEWCWLLRVYERLSGKDISLYTDKLYNGALDYGWNDELGLICDVIPLDGSSISNTYRTWPQTELIKASVAEAAAGNQAMFKTASNAIEALFKHYLSVPIRGGWADKIAKDGSIISSVMPTSTFYHLFCAAAEVHALAERL